MNTGQVEVNRNVGSSIPPHIQQNKIIDETVPVEINMEAILLSENMQAKIVSLQARINVLDDELSEKELLIERIKKDREILIDANEELEEKLENFIADHREYFKQKILIL